MPMDHPLCPIFPCFGAVRVSVSRAWLCKQKQPVLWSQQSQHRAVCRHEKSCSMSPLEQKQQSGLFVVALLEEVCVP